MFESFLRSLQESCGIEVGTKLVVACSAGADSTALLHLLAMASGPLQLQLTVAHLDHGLREESPEDARFVQGLAARLGLPCVIAREDIAALARNRRENLEAAGRKVRREFLQRVARDSLSSHIALGHHRDDQAETVLFRLLRGCGSAGLSAMLPCDPPYVRPLLVFSREQLQSFLFEQNLPWHEDDSNLDLSRTRNKLRHQVLPLLGEVQTDAAQKLADLASRTAVDEDFWQQAVQTWVVHHVVAEGNGISLPFRSLAELHPALRVRVWLHLLRQVGTAQEYGAMHLNACEALLSSSRPQLAVDLPGLWAAKRYQVILLCAAPPQISEDWLVEISAPGDYLLPDGRTLQVSLADSGGTCDADGVAFDAKQVPFPLQMRNRRPGDRFFPGGAPGSRKLKDFFIDARFSHEQRAAQPLLVADQVLWVIGVRRCHGLIAETPDRVLRCRLVQGAEKDNTA